MIAEAALIRVWERLGLPQYLQLDNQSPFLDSNRHPRSFSIVIKLCLLLNDQSVFIPLNEPWCNRCIEKLTHIHISPANGGINDKQIQARI
jgi:hypothetical protein